MPRRLGTLGVSADGRLANVSMMECPVSSAMYFWVPSVSVGRGGQLDG